MKGGIIRQDSMRELRDLNKQKHIALIESGHFEE